MFFLRFWVAAVFWGIFYTMSVTVSVSGTEMRVDLASSPDVNSLFSAPEYQGRFETVVRLCSKDGETRAGLHPDSQCCDGMSLMLEVRKVVESTAETTAYPLFWTSIRFLPGENWGYWASSKPQVQMNYRLRTGYTAKTRDSRFHKQDDPEGMIALDINHPEFIATHLTCTSPPENRTLLPHDPLDRNRYSQTIRRAIFEWEIGERWTVHDVAKSIIQTASYGDGSSYFPRFWIYGVSANGGFANCAIGALLIAKEMGVPTHLVKKVDDYMTMCKKGSPGRTFANWTGIGFVGVWISDSLGTAAYPSLFVKAIHASSQARLAGTQIVLVSQVQGGRPGTAHNSPLATLIGGNYSSGWQTATYAINA